MQIYAIERSVHLKKTLGYCMTVITELLNFVSMFACWIRNVYMQYNTKHIQYSDYNRDMLICVLLLHIIMSVSV